ncbi:DUF2970 domain-containing protein [Pseudomonas sp. FME51]|uniref:DUF2970 domain-containing protein n=1 Tax=Pseudomonas sp. FME51 TaxID=2742609 RepID=UPI0018694726|nr:DUF2970 domain-containing protein [Pseudomonas sp. FME51]
MTDKKNNERNESSSPRKMRLRDMFSTILFGALGVQSNKARERDFSQGKPSHFIYFGLGFMLVFILGLVGIVKLVTHLAG